MSTIQLILFIFLSYHIIVLTVTTYNRLTAELTNQKESIVPIHTASNPYEFDDPLTAYYILQKLDIFEEEELLGFQQKKPRTLNKPVMSVVPDDEYCDKHRAHIVYHPESIFKEKNIVTSLSQVSLLRKTVIPSIGSDIQPNVYSRRRKNRQGHVFELKPDITVYFSPIDLYFYRRVGKQFSCLTQASSSVPGHGHLYKKDLTANALAQYAANYQSRPSCFNFGKFFPRTWVLYDKSQCEEFFVILNSPDYQKAKEQKGIIYLRKVGAGVHRGKGVVPLDSNEEENIKSIFENGALCGRKNKNYIIQSLIYNPLLLDGHKFDFRTFVLIASSNPVIAYFYNEAQLRVSLHPYSTNSTEKGAMLTNVALAKSMFKFARRNGTYNGMTVDELKHAHLWTFQRLQDYLYQKGIITDQNWLDNYLRSEFKKAVIHLIRMSQSYFELKSSAYHLLGLDFMLDSDLNLWFIETNTKPALEALSKENGEFKTKMLEDHFEIIYGLLRSRMKRIVAFVNEVIRKEDFRVDSPDEFLIFELLEKREKFKQVTKNYFEKEYEPSESNGFQPIIDDNKVGTERYFGLIAEGCV